MNQCLQILDKDPRHRTDEDVESLLRLTSKIQFFQQITDQQKTNLVHQKCCQQMKLLNLKNSEIVFEIDSYGDKFYILLKGQVGIYIRKTDQTKETITEARNTGALATYGMSLVKQLQAGDSFGEIALLHNRPRMATIKCFDDCSFGVLSRKEFNNILKVHEKEKLQKNIEYFQSLSLCKEWNYHLVRYIYLNSFLKTYSKGEYIYKEGDPSDGFYIVKTGQFHVQKTIEIKKFDEADKLLMKKKRKKFTKVKIIILGPKEIFGEDDLANYSTRSSEVVCESHEGQLVFINQSDFYGKIYKEEVSKTYLDQVKVTKQVFVQKRIEETLSAKFIPLSQNEHRKNVSLRTAYTQKKKIALLREGNSDNYNMITLSQKDCQENDKCSTFSQNLINQMRNLSQCKGRFEKEALLKSDPMLRLTLHHTQQKGCLSSTQLGSEKRKSGATTQERESWVKIVGKNKSMNGNAKERYSILKVANWQQGLSLMRHKTEAPISLFEKLIGKTHLNHQRNSTTIQSFFSHSSKAQDPKSRFIQSLDISDKLKPQLQKVLTHSRKLNTCESNY